MRIFIRTYFQPVSASGSFIYETGEILLSGHRSTFGRIEFDNEDWHSRSWGIGMTQSILIRRILLMRLVRD